jgi:hypothetical protein
MGRPPSHRLRGASAEQLINAERLLIWLSNVVQFVKLMSGSQPGPLGELHPDGQLNAAPPADTRRVPTSRLRRFLGTGPDSAPTTVVGCACTFYLVFKEPALPAVHHPASISPCGEPYENNQISQPCQAFLSPYLLSGFRFPDGLRTLQIPAPSLCCGRNTVKGTAC